MKAFDTRTPTAREVFSRLGLSLVLLTVGTTVGRYAIGYLLLWLAPDTVHLWWANRVVSVVPLYGIGLPLMYLSLRGLSSAPHNATCSSGFITYGKPAFTVGSWVRILFMGFGCMYVGSIIGNALMGILSGLTGYSYANTLETVVEQSPVWATLLGICVIAPLGEELIFRKLFIDRARRFGDTAAILLSALLFGLFHANLFQFFYAFMLGILLAYVYTRTGKLSWCVVMHAAVNLMGSVAIPALSDLIPDDLTVALTLTQLLVALFISAWAYGTIIAAIVLLIKRFRWRVLSPAPDQRPTRSVLRDAFSSTGMIAAVLLLTSSILLGLALPVILSHLQQITL